MPCLALCCYVFSGINRNNLIASSTSCGLIANSLDMFADAAVHRLALFVVGQSARKKQLKAARICLVGYTWVWLQLLIFDVLRRLLLRQ